jgi:hypothetical protein
MGRARILSLCTDQQWPSSEEDRHTLRSKRFMALARFMLSHMKTNLAPGCSFLIVFNVSSSIILMSTKTKWKVRCEFRPSGKSFAKLSESSASNRTGWQLKASKLASSAEMSKTKRGYVLGLQHRPRRSKRAEDETTSITISDATTSRALEHTLEIGILHS